MPWIITLPIGILIGVMFSVAFPSIAVSLNDAIAPTVFAIGNKLIEIITNIIFQR